MIRNAMQHGENVRNSLVLNYKSAALNQLSYAGVPHTRAGPTKNGSTPGAWNTFQPPRNGYLTSAHVDGRSFNPVVNQRSANIATTAVETIPTITETAPANG
jgi:hypothetical protein